MHSTGKDTPPGSDAAILLSNGIVRVETMIVSGVLKERYLAHDGAKWVAIAVEGGVVGPCSAFLTSDCAVGGKVISIRSDDAGLVEEISFGKLQVTRRIALVGKGPWIRVSTQIRPQSSATMHAFVDSFRFIHEPDWCYSPSVGGIVPDAQYKAPLVLAQSKQLVFGIVPDVTELSRSTLLRCHHALDLVVPEGPVLSVGFKPCLMASHSIYKEDPSRTWPADTVFEHSYFLLVGAAEIPGQAFREGVRMHWRSFGRPSQMFAAAQQAGTQTPDSAYAWLETKCSTEQQRETDRRFPEMGLWDDWRDAVWQVLSKQQWLRVPLPSTATGGGVRTHRWGPGPSIYLSAWFNTLRTSFGMALYAQRIQDDTLLCMAEETLKLALEAPGIDGAFKCIVVPSGESHPEVWAAGDGCGESTEDGYLGYDMCWTGYWMLRWRGAKLPGSSAVLPRCRALARFFIHRQSENGFLPTRFSEGGHVVAESSRQVKAETGAVALFLLELYIHDKDPRWFDAGRRGLSFMEQNVIASRQWYDFETFWSCSPRKAVLDEKTRQWPANDLALGQTVAAYLAAFRITNDRSFLDKGESLLDYLLLYQQCWTNPTLEGLTCPTMLLGGFTTQNSDAEWSDARQSQFGNLLLDYYRATNKCEYLERGVAALRAQFPVSPSENWAHCGYGSKSGISSFHWGTGSGMAGIEIEEDYLRDAVVDLGEGRGVGVNGINLTECHVREDAIQLRCTSPFRWQRPPVFTFHGIDPHRGYRIYANGKEQGTWRGTELEIGVALPSALPAN